MTTVISEPGVYPDLGHDEYLADPVPWGSLSSSGAKRLLPPSCPALFRYWADNPEPPRDEFDFGTAAHKAVLNTGPVIYGVIADDWRTKAAREQRDFARSKGWVPLLAKDEERIRDMVKALQEHPIAAALLDPAGGVPEQSLFWTDDETQVMRRARLDWLPHRQEGRRLLIADYKTTTCADPEAFAKSAYNYGYFTQAAWYLDGIKALGLAGDEDPQLVFVAQEKTPPYLVTVAYADAAALDWARARNRDAIRRYADCMAADHWPSYSEDVVPLSLPAWVEKRHLEETYI